MFIGIKDNELNEEESDDELNEEESDDEFKMFIQYFF